jgi:hypothetical protein
MAQADWQVWSTHAPHTIDLNNRPTTPEDAALSACLWDLEVDDGSWFGGGVATLGIQAPNGDRWTCVATMTAENGVVLTPMVRLA